MTLEQATNIVNYHWIIGTIAQAFVEMVDKQPSNVRIYDYELKFEDYNDIHQRTLIPAPALPRDDERIERLIRHSVSSFADFLLERDIVLGEPDSIEVTYGTPELGVDDVPDMYDNMIRATLCVTWKSKRDSNLSSKKGGPND